MSLQTLSLSQLIPSKANPRKNFDKKAVEGLAASIRTDGLLQNLVVRPLEEDGDTYCVISGGRRYRALKLLEKNGTLPKDFRVPVEIKDSITDEDSLRIATVENLQRAALAPLEEAAALTKLVHKGIMLEEVVAQTGLSSSTIRRRLALNDLCAEAMQALRKSEITVSQAEALSLGSKAMQQEILERIGNGFGDYSAQDIRNEVLQARPSVALAIFPLEAYTGTITTDLFAEDETSYFDDTAQFFKLQTQAVEALADDYRSTVSWVEITKGYNAPLWQYRTTKSRKKSGVVINLAPSGAVTTHEGLTKRKIDEKIVAASQDVLSPSVKAKPEYAAPLRRYFATQKSVAVQNVLLANPRKAKEVAAVQALESLRFHPCLRMEDGIPASQLSASAVTLAAKNYACELNGASSDEDMDWTDLHDPRKTSLERYEAVKKLTDENLDGLLRLLAVMCFGQLDCDSLDTGDSLFNRVAIDLNLDMRRHWSADRPFLERNSRQQLLNIAAECGLCDLYSESTLKTYKKSELVASLLNLLEGCEDDETPSPSRIKVLTWLPGAMRFPAIKSPEEGKVSEPDTD